MLIRLTRLFEISVAALGLACYRHDHKTERIAPTRHRVMAVQSKRAVGEGVTDSLPADLWRIEGDSVRLPDGALLPRTLGELRARYGKVIVGENITADDYDGPSARSCRFPYLRIALESTDTARIVPDSARVTAVEMNGPPDSGLVRVCAAPSDRLPR